MSLFDQALSLERATTTQDNSGGTVREWAEQADGILCAVQPASSHTIDVYARREITVTHMIYSRAEINSLVSGGLRENDRFVDAAGNYYLVRGIKRHSNLSLSLSLLYEIAAEQRI